MVQEIVGSHFAPDAMYGQNGSDTPSSIQPGDKIKRSKVAKTIIAGDGSVSAAPGNWQTRNVPAGQGVKTNPGTKGASKGGSVPAAVDRRKS